MAPAGYEKLKVAALEKLEDKEVYLVQVPKNFDTRKAEFKSNTEVSCDGTTYFVNSGAMLAGCDILNTDKEGKLIPSSTKLSGLLSLTKKVSLPKVDYEKVAQPKPLVPQRKNLRMRHFPSGYGPENYGITTEAATEDTKHAAASTAPSAEKKPSESKKPHKHKHDRDNEDASEKPAKKHKKNSDEKKKSKKEKHKSKD